MIGLTVLNTTNETYIDYEQHIAYKIDEFIEKNTNENVKDIYFTNITFI